MTSFFTSKKNPAAKQGYTAYGWNQGADTYCNPQINPNNPHNKGKPGSAWNDDDENELDQIIQQEAKQNSQKVPSILINSVASTKDSIEHKPPSSDRSNLSQREASHLQLITLNTELLNKHSYENHVVNDIIVPGGVRLKQPDADLTSFCRTSGGLNAQIIGSLLISKTTAQINWISKARALYAIEALAQKSDKYAQFFKHNIKTLRSLNFGEGETNNEQLRKVLDEVLNHLEQTQTLSKIEKKAVSLPLKAGSTSTLDNEEPSLQTVEAKKSQAKLNLPMAPSKFASAGSNTPSTPATNTSSDNTLKLPLNQMGNLASSLSDLDFTGPSPFNDQPAQQIAASWDTFSPLHYQNNQQAYYNSQAMHFSQAYQNMQNMQNRQNMMNMQNRAAYYQNLQQNMINMQQQAQRSQPQQQEGPKTLWQDPEVFKQDFGIDYDAEEKKKVAKQALTEKKFDTLDFKF